MNERVLRGSEAGSPGGDAGTPGSEQVSRETCAVSTENERVLPENTPETAPFSLLISVYHKDTPAQLRRALESSVTEQQVRPAEVVLVRDGRVSASLQCEIERLAGMLPCRVRLVELAKNGGLAAALQAGLAACSYDVVARMDADDISLPQRFARQWPVFQRENLDLLGAGMVEFSGDAKNLGTRRVPPAGAAQVRKHARTHNPCNHPTVMFRKAAVQAVGGYAEMGSMEDYWLFVRLIHKGYKVDNLPEPLLLYNVGGVYGRRGGLKAALTELRLQREMRKIGFITVWEYIFNSALKSAYRLFPANLKRAIFTRFVAGGLPGEKRKNSA
ncbi:MAG: glycosyltransferase [Microbacteriaceae bacterium]|nr:glycosyltransferase [Microbacteriaceae bacterium]